MRTKYIYMHHTVGTAALSDFDLHCHGLYEIIYFEGGDISYLIEGKEYRPKPYSVLLMAPNVFHGVRIMSSEPYKRYVLHFSSKLIPDDIKDELLSFYDGKTHAVRNYYENIARFGLRGCFENIFQCREMPHEMQDTAVSVAVQNLLVHLLYMSKTEDTTIPQNINSSVSEIIKYLNDNIASPVSLDFLSKRFYISKHHLNKVFRQATGTTVGKYISYKRVTQAQQLIMQGYSAQRAAIEAGFGDYSSFYRAYTHLLGHSPGEDKSAVMM